MWFNIIEKGNNQIQSSKLIKSERNVNLNRIYLNMGTEKSCTGILPVKLLDDRSLFNKENCKYYDHSQPVYELTRGTRN